MSTYTTPSGVALDLRLTSGLIEVSTSDGDTTTVTLEPLSHDDQARELIEATREEAVSEADGSLRIVVHVPEKTGIRRFLGTPEVLIRITASTGARLNATTASADVRCSGRLGGAAIKTASGDVTLPEVHGGVEVRTASGDVRVADVTGELRAQSMSGDVTTGDIGGDAFAKSMSGDVSLGMAAGSVEASSMSGDIKVAGVRKGTATLSSMSGDVDVAVVPRIAGVPGRVHPVWRSPLGAARVRPAVGRRRRRTDPARQHQVGRRAHPTRGRPGGGRVVASNCRDGRCLAPASG